jgi:hypothetical protein
MGTDIAFYAEVFRHGIWQPAPEPAITEWSQGELVAISAIDFGRPYQLFMALAGVCQGNLRRTMHAMVNPISEPRGLPQDMNDFYKQTLLGDAYDGCCFAHSWLLLKEIIEYDWDGQFVTQRAYVKNEYAHLFKAGTSFPEDFPENQSLYFLLPNWQQESDTAEVSWVTSYRDYVGCSQWFIEELLKLGMPDTVRVIFWFDA